MRILLWLLTNDNGKIPIINCQITEYEIDKYGLLIQVVINTIISCDIMDNYYAFRGCKKFITR